jgi:hypothetical protein
MLYNAKKKQYFLSIFSVYHSLLLQPVDVLVKPFRHSQIHSFPESIASSNFPVHGKTPPGFIDALSQMFFSIGKYKKRF